MIVTINRLTNIKSATTNEHPCNGATASTFSIVRNT